MADHLTPKQRIWLRDLIRRPAGHLASATHVSLVALERKGFARFEIEPDRVLVVRWFATGRPRP